MKNRPRINRDFRKYLFRRYETLGRRQRFRGTTREAFEAWQSQARDVLAQTLRMPDELGTPELVREPLDPSSLPWEGRRPEGFRIERVYYQSMPDVRVTAYLLIPESLSAPAPAVLCPPAHLLSGQSTSGMNAAVFEKGIHKQYPCELARRGFVTLIPEHIGFGERHPPLFGEHGYYTGVAQLLGFTMYGVYVKELIRGLDVLTDLEEVDSTRIGCWGLSLGGITTMLISALDPRIRVVGISGFFTSFLSTYMHVAHCVCGNVQDLALQFEHIDICALSAPRPMLVESGRIDGSFPCESATKSMRELRQTYALCGQEDRLVHDIFDGEHEVSGRLAFDWFERWLKPESASRFDYNFP